MHLSFFNWCLRAVPTSITARHAAVKLGARAYFPPKLSLYKVFTFPKIFAFKPKVKTVAETLSFVLRIWPGNLLMDILRDSQLVIFFHSTTFITLIFPTKVSQVFSSKSCKVQGFKKPEVALNFCVWPLCNCVHLQHIGQCINQTGRTR